MSLFFTSRLALSKALHTELSDLRVWDNDPLSITVECIHADIAALIHDLGGMGAAW